MDGFSRSSIILPLFLSIDSIEGCRKDSLQLGDARDVERIHQRPRSNTTADQLQHFLGQVDNTLLLIMMLHLRLLFLRFGYLPVCSHSHQAFAGQSGRHAIL